MGYALKLGRVNFSDVAVDQVNYIDETPCTGLSLDQDSLSFESVGETETLTATKVPADTTDELTWESSDENVATVVDGVVTIHGIGTATITATCGQQTASALINQTSIKPMNGSKLLMGYIPEDYSGYVWVNPQTGQNMFGQDYDGTETLRVENGSTREIQMIPVPYGATKAKIATTGGTAVTVSFMYIADMTDLVGTTTKYPRYKERKDFINTNNGASVSYGECIAFRATDSSTGTLEYVYFT